jgi:hypothetical protein
VNHKELTRRRDRDEATARQRFTHDVRHHRLAIKQDDGLHRHLKYRKHGPHRWLHWFELVTWPGSLAIRGDMGSYQFSRIDDMFEFFRRRDGGINPSYWAEKLDTIDKHGPVMAFDTSHARAVLADQVEDWPSDAKREAFDEIGRVLDDHCDQHGQAFREACERFEYVDARDYTDPKKHTFSDVWEWGSAQVYTYRFLWCLRAIVWGIAQYDKAKAAPATVTP